VRVIQKALHYVAVKHGDQKYGEGVPYMVHLACVVSILHEFNAPHIVVSAGALHDVLEDTDTEYGELAWEFGPHIADLVLAVTNPKTGTRKEKHAIQYPKILEYGTYAIMIKLADRIANVESGGKIDMYRNEHVAFQEALRQPIGMASYPVLKMWDVLNDLLKDDR
jgi:GTP pyrophosphokinase